MKAKLQVCSRVAVAAYLFLVPLLLPVPAGLLSHDAARLAQVFIAAVCALGVVEHWLTTTHSAGQRRSAVVWLLAVAIVVGGGLSCIYAAHPVWALRELGLWVGMFFVTLAVAADRNGRVLLYWAAVAGTLLYNVVSLLMPVLALLLGERPGSPDALDYNNVRFLNHVQTVALPLIAAGAVTMAQTVRSRFVVNAALVTGFVLLFFTGGRATAVALTIACLLAAPFPPPSPLPPPPPPRAGLALIQHLALTALMGALLYFILLRWMPATLGLSGYQEGLMDRAGDLGSAERRLYLWRLALDALAASPWVGIGPMHYAHQPNGEAAHPHNIYLQVMVEWGVITSTAVFLAVLFSLWAFVRRIRNRERRNDAREGVGWLVCLIAILVDGGASGNFVMPVSQVWIAVCVGWALQWWQCSAFSARALPHSLWVGRGMTVGAALLVIWLAADTALQAPRLGGINEASRAMSPGRLNPRYWSSGWF
jgi:O-antigen ligase